MFKLILVLAIVAYASGAAVVYQSAVVPAVPSKASVAVSNANGNYAYSVSEQHGVARPVVVASAPVVAPAAHVVSYGAYPVYYYG